MQFNENNQDFNKEQAWDGPRQSFMTKSLIKTGLVKDETQANYVLIGIAVVFFAITVVMITGVGSNKPTQEPTYLEDIPESERANIPPELLENIPSRN